IYDGSRNVRLTIDLRRIEICIQKFAKFSQRLIQLALFRLRNARIRHHPVRDEMSLKKSFRKAERLGPCKKQFLSLLNLFLSLRVEFVHSIKKRATNSSRACSHVQSGATPLCGRTRRDSEIRYYSREPEARPQLQPWLVPQSMQTPQAPARMTLSLPHTEHVMPMKMLPSATVTRSGELLVPLPFPWADAPPFA